MPTSQFSVKGFVGIIVKITFVIALAMLLFGFLTPFAKTNLGLTANSIDLIFEIPFTGSSVVLPSIDISQQTISASMTYGLILMAATLLIVIVLYDPINYLREIKHKREINTELSKMNKTLEKLKKFN